MMLKTIIKNICMFALFAGIVLPISAMDSSEDSSIFTWSNAATLVACVGAGYLLYSSWSTKPVGRTKSSRIMGKKPQATAMYQPQDEVHTPIPDDEVNPLFLSQEVVAFGKLSLIDQKRAFCSRIDAYLQIPVVIYEEYQELKDDQLSNEVHHAIDTQVDAEDLIMQYVQIIELRTKSHKLDIAVHKMFSAKSKAARQVEALKIKASLGL